MSVPKCDKSFTNVNRNTSKVNKCKERMVLNENQWIGESRLAGEEIIPWIIPTWRSPQPTPTKIGTYPLGFKYKRESGESECNTLWMSQYTSFYANLAESGTKIKLWFVSLLGLVPSLDLGKDKWGWGMFVTEITAKGPQKMDQVTQMFSCGFTGSTCQHLKHKRESELIEEITTQKYHAFTLI